MRRRVEYVVVGCAVFGLALWLGGLGSGERGIRASNPDPPVPADAQRARVAHVIDGDTVWIRVPDRGGPLARGEHRVRLLGVDSPELATGSGEPECGAIQARAFLRTLLPEDSPVWLLADREDKDRFDRPMRYVWTADGRFVNRLLVSAGHARSVLFEPNDRYWPLLREGQAQARAGGEGLWACPHP